MNHNIQSCEVIGIDIAKNSFALHGADASGKPVYKFTGSRRKMLSKLAKAPSTKIYMEACGGAHCLGREFQKMGHEVELIPPIYVKAFVKRQKNDANDAAAIVEAASRPTMRKLKIKSEATQARASLFRARQLLVTQRTQTANSVRGLLTEFGVTVAKGLQNLERLRELVSMNKELPDDLLLALDVLFTTMDRLNEDIDFLTEAISTEVSRDEDAKRLMEIPGIGPITAFAILAFAGDLNGFRNGREFAAWVGLTPKEHSTGGRHRTGSITKMGQRDIRRLLVSGAMSVLQQAARRKSENLSPWLQRMLAQGKPRMVVAVALANRTARVAWALIARQTDYDPTKGPCLG